MATAYNLVRMVRLVASTTASGGCTAYAGASRGSTTPLLDPLTHQGGIVIVNTARGIVGDNAAALIGSTLLNLVTLAVAEQARLEPGGRWPISMFVDES